MIKHIFSALSSKERIAFVVAGVIFILSILTLAGRSIYTRTNVVPAHGGAYAEGFVGQPTYVNPALASSDIDRSLIRLMFSNLADLTDSVETSKDGKTWKVHLKQDLTWSDGHKLTSDDVVFTVAQIQNSETRSPLAGSWQGISALRVSDLVVQFSLASPYAFLNDSFKALYPIPKHIYNDIPSSNWRLSDYTLKPAGSGPYVFDTFEKDAKGFIQTYSMKVNPEFTGEKAFIEHVDFLFFPDGDSLLQAFNKGTVQGITSPDLGTLTGVNRSYRTHAFSIPSYYAVFFNQTESVPLKEAAVRQALNVSINRNDLVKEVFEGHAAPAYGPIPPGSGKSMASSSEPSLDAAAKILDDAGWKVGADGVRQKEVKDGSIRLELVLTVPEIPFLTKTADTLKNIWHQLGFQMTVTPLPTGDTMAQTIKNRDYQALLFGNVLSPSLNLYPFWNSKERFAPGLNLALYSNKTVDDLTAAIEIEQNADVRLQKLQEAEAAIVADLPAIFLYSPQYLYLASKEVRGVESVLIAEPADRFLQLPKWYVKTTRAVK